MDFRWDLTKKNVNTVINVSRYVHMYPDNLMKMAIWRYGKKNADSADYVFPCVRQEQSIIVRRK